MAGSITWLMICWLLALLVVYGNLDMEIDFVSGTLAGGPGIGYSRLHMSVLFFAIQMG